MFWNSLERDETGGLWTVVIRENGEHIEHALIFREVIEHERKIPSNLIALSEGEIRL